MLSSDISSEWSLPKVGKYKVLGVSKVTQRLCSNIQLYTTSYGVQDCIGAQLKSCQMVPFV